MATRKHTRKREPVAVNGRQQRSATTVELAGVLVQPTARGMNMTELAQLKEFLDAVTSKLDSVQSYVTVCRNSLQEQSCDDDVHVAHLLLRASDMLNFATQALRGDEEAIKEVRS